MPSCCLPFCLCSCFSCFSWFKKMPFFLNTLAIRCGVLLGYASLAQPTGLRASSTLAIRCVVLLGEPCALRKNHPTYPPACLCRHSALRGFLLKPLFDSFDIVYTTIRYFAKEKSREKARVGKRGERPGGLCSMARKCQLCRNKFVAAVIPALCRGGTGNLLPVCDSTRGKTTKLSGQAIRKQD